jgi:hypothetical protein
MDTAEDPVGPRGENGVFTVERSAVHEWVGTAKYETPRGETQMSYLARPCNTAIWPYHTNRRATCMVPRVLQWEPGGNRNPVLVFGASNTGAEFANVATAYI